jgi:predicted flap endonuclease-1-like 5' DNA nuclease
MASILDIEGVGEQYADKLKVMGIASTDALLEKGCSAKGRSEITEKSGIGAKLVLRWVNHADLFRIKGVAGQYAELLEAAGVDTLVELSKRKPDNLYEAMVKCNTEKRVVRALPSQDKVGDWVAQAKALPRKVQY